MSCQLGSHYLKLKEESSLGFEDERGIALVAPGSTDAVACVVTPQHGVVPAGVLEGHGFTKIKRGNVYNKIENIQTALIRVLNKIFPGEAGGINDGNLCEYISTFHFFNAIGHVSNPEKMRGAEVTLSADTMSKLRKMRQGDGQFIKATPWFLHHDFVSESRAEFDRLAQEDYESKTADDDTAATAAAAGKVYYTDSKGNQKELKKPLSFGIVYLQFLMRWADDFTTDGLEVTSDVERRDSGNPFEGASWALFLTKVFGHAIGDWGGNGCTIYTKDGKAIKKDKDGKKLDVDTNELLKTVRGSLEFGYTAQDVRDDEGYIEWKAAVIHNLENTGMGKTEETKIINFFTGELRNSSDQLIRQVINEDLREEGFGFAEVRYLPKADEVKYQAWVLEDKNFDVVDFHKGSDALKFASAVRTGNAFGDFCDKMLSFSDTHWEKSGKVDNLYVSVTRECAHKVAHVILNILRAIALAVVFPLTFVMMMFKKINHDNVKNVAFAVVVDGVKPSDLRQRVEEDVKKSNALIRMEHLTLPMSQDGLLHQEPGRRGTTVSHYEGYKEVFAANGESRTVLYPNGDFVVHIYTGVASSFTKIGDKMVQVSTLGADGNYTNIRDSSLNEKRVSGAPTWDSAEILAASAS